MDHSDGYTDVYSLYRTYEELKLVVFLVPPMLPHGLYRTYEELKPVISKNATSGMSVFVSYL